MSALIASMTPQEAGKDLLPEMIDMDAARQWWVARLHPSGIWCPKCSSGDFSEQRTRTWWDDRRIKCADCGQWFSNRSGTILSGVDLNWRQMYLLLVLKDRGFSNAEIARRLAVHPDTVARFLRRLESARA